MRVHVHLELRLRGLGVLRELPLRSLAEVAVQDAMVHLEGRLPLRLLRLLSLLLRLRFRLLRLETAGHAEVGREWPICCGSTPPHL